jgi:enamine deaminase RidA (YjgF/YER057c/UK114 family)
MTSEDQDMRHQAINPPNLYNSLQFGFSHAVRHGGGDTLELAGQVAWDAEGKLVGAGDLAAQARQALDNLRAVLQSVGAGPANIVRLRTYVVDHSLAKLGPVSEEIMRFYGSVTPAANTWIGVQALAMAEFLVEIEATAILPADAQA